MALLARHEGDEPGPRVFLEGFSAHAGPGYSIRAESPKIGAQLAVTRNHPSAGQAPNYKRLHMSARARVLCIAILDLDNLLLPDRLAETVTVGDGRSARKETVERRVRERAVFRPR